MDSPFIFIYLQAAKTEMMCLYLFGGINKLIKLKWQVLKHSLTIIIIMSKSLSHSQSYNPLFPLPLRPQPSFHLLALSLLILSLLLLQISDPRQPEHIFSSSPPLTVLSPPPSHLATANSGRTAFKWDISKNVSWNNPSPIKLKSIILQEQSSTVTEPFSCVCPFSLNLSHFSQHNNCFVCMQYNFLQHNNNCF